jgi:phosphoribosylanthranilate isomerase
VTRVKICGLIEISHAIVAAESGADFVGLVFASSRRQVSMGKARQLAETVHNLRTATAVVGVFVNSAIEEVNRIADYCNLDWVQLSGDETWHYCQQIKRPIIKAVHISTTIENGRILDVITAGCRQVTHQELVCLLDSKMDGMYGGTGHTFNWELAREVSVKFPVIIAGGLTPDNVGRLVEEVQPWGVDVSTGVESNGQKDETKILAFIEAVKKAEG